MGEQGGRPESEAWTQDEPVYTAVPCGRCGLPFPEVLRTPADDEHLALCEQCRGAMFAAAHPRLDDRAGGPLRTST